MQGTDMAKISWKTTGSAGREMRAEVFIDASPNVVWGALTNFRNMADASPELVTMKPLTSGGLKKGQRYVGINRRRAMVWPTMNVIVDVEPRRRLEWATTTSGANWIFELTPEDEGTRLVQRRTVPKKITSASNLVAGALLGGAENHADELDDSMEGTLAHIKTVAEST